MAGEHEHFRRYYPDPQAVIDELVRCNRAVTVDGNVLYQGWLIELPAPSVANFTGTNGVWTESGTTGTHYTVLKSGKPAGNQCSIDMASGEVLTSTSIDLYVRYESYGRLQRISESAGQSMAIHGFLDYSATTEVYREEVPVVTRFRAAFASCVEPVSANLVITIDKMTGEGSESGTVTISSGNTSGSAAFSPYLLFQPGEHILLTVPSNSANANNVIVTLVKG